MIANPNRFISITLITILSAVFPPLLLITVPIWILTVINFGRGVRNIHDVNKIRNENARLRALAGK